MTNKILEQLEKNLEVAVCDTKDGLAEKKKQIVALVEKDAKQKDQVELRKLEEDM